MDQLEPVTTSRGRVAGRNQTRSQLLQRVHKPLRLPLATAVGDREHRGAAAHRHTHPPAAGHPADTDGEVTALELDHVGGVRAAGGCGPGAGGVVGRDDVAPVGAVGVGHADAAMSIR